MYDWCRSTRPTSSSSSSFSPANRTFSSKKEYETDTEEDRGSMMTRKNRNEKEQDSEEDEGTIRRRKQNMVPLLNENFSVSSSPSSVNVAQQPYQNVYSHQHTPHMHTVQMNTDNFNY